jgi:hypothetical protein
LLARQESRENAFFPLNHVFLSFTQSHHKNLKHERKYAKLFPAIHLECGTEFSTATEHFRLFSKGLFFSTPWVGYSCSKVSLQLKPPVSPWVRGRMSGSKAAIFQFLLILHRNKSLGMESFGLFVRSPWSSEVTGLEVGRYKLQGMMHGPQSECYFLYFYIHLLSLLLLGNFY